MTEDLTYSIKEMIKEFRDDVKEDLTEIYLFSIVNSMARNAKSNPVRNFSFVLFAFISPIVTSMRQVSFFTKLAVTWLSKFFAHPQMKSNITYLLSFPYRASFFFVNMLLAVFSTIRYFCGAIDTFRFTAFPSRRFIARNPPVIFSFVPRGFTFLGNKVAFRRAGLSSTILDSARLNIKNFTTNLTRFFNTAKSSHTTIINLNKQMYKLCIH